MIKHLARVFLLLTGFCLLAHYLPYGWRLLNATRQSVPVVQYSDTGHGFIFTAVKFTRDNAEIIYSDREGGTYTRDEAEAMLPLTYYLQLYKNGTMPSEIKGTKITSAKIQREQFSIRIRPDELDAPAVALYPVLEAESGRASLEMPADFMRIRQDARIEFIAAKTNTLDAPKGQRFTEAFTRAGFVFPTTVVGGNPTTRKSYDEGYYLTDSTGQTFHLRQVRGEPEVTRIATVAADAETWRSLRPRYLLVNEIETRELRVIVIDEAGQLWLVVGENYRLVKLPLTKYSPEGATLSLRGNILSRVAIVQSDTAQEAVALDRDYQVLDRWEGKLTPFEELTAGKTAAVLFPFSWWMEDSRSAYFGFYSQLGALPALAVNGFLLIVYVVWLRIRKRRFSAGQIPEFLIIAAGGICGFIPALLLPRTE